LAAICACGNRLRGLRLHTQNLRGDFARAGRDKENHRHGNDLDPCLSAQEIGQRPTLAAVMIKVIKCTMQVDFFGVHGAAFG
jgi:hypothetical protein